MNRTVKLALAILAAGTTAVGASAFALGADAGHPRLPLLTAMLVVIPLTTWVILVWSGRKLASERPRLADDHKRHLQGALVFHFVVLALIEVWLANAYVGAPPPLDRESFARLVFIVMGVAMAVRGNFLGKLSPPSGEAAPDPGAWTRTLLRTGWAMSILGAALVASALVLPSRVMILVPLVVLPALVAVAAAHRRVMGKQPS